MSRTQRIGIAFSAFVAFAVGVITLLSLLLGDHPELYSNFAGAPVFARLLTLPAAIMVRLVAITAAVTIVIGIFNLLYVHMGRGGARGIFQYRDDRQLWPDHLVVCEQTGRYVATGGGSSADRIGIGSALVLVHGARRRPRIGQARRYLGPAFCHGTRRCAAGHLAD